MRVIGVILAGGTSRRMGSAGNGPERKRDKAQEKLAGESLFDHVLARLAPQVTDVLIAGPSDYRSGLVAVADIPGGAEGPVAGIRAAHDHLTRKAETDSAPRTAIVTVPADCPFLPDDLVARLSATGHAAIASGDGRLQPAFGFWPLTVIAIHHEALRRPGWLSLQRWAKLCGAREIDFGETGDFLNINRREDLAVAERLIAGRRQTPGV